MSKAEAKKQHNKGWIEAKKGIDILIMKSPQERGQGTRAGKEDVETIRYALCWSLITLIGVKIMCLKYDLRIIMPKRM